MTPRRRRSLRCKTKRFFCGPPLSGLQGGQITGRIDRGDKAAGFNHATVESCSTSFSATLSKFAANPNPVPSIGQENTKKSWRRSPFPPLRSVELGGNERGRKQVQMTPYHAHRRRPTTATAASLRRWRPSARRRRRRRRAK